MEVGLRGLVKYNMGVRTLEETSEEVEGYRKV